jgi:bifunctional non-homologous end joining protein LigD
MALEEYREKRDFERTPEPTPPLDELAAPLPDGRVDTEGRAIFVVQEHHASHLHWDFRLEMGGVLKSWAVPKGPPEETGIKRLAMMVEDHPLDYASFAGTIPEGEYGAGSVRIWDRGTWEAVGEKSGEEQLAEGAMKFVLHGERLQGGYALVKFAKAGGNTWLLMKEKA